MTSSALKLERQELPHSEEAEQVLLAAVIFGHNAVNWHAVLQYLSGDDFYLPAHRRIFRAMLDMDNHGASIDKITLKEKLKRQGDLAKSGGPHYLDELEAKPFLVTSLMEYTHIIYDCSVRRALIFVADEIMKSAYQRDKDYKVILEESERKLFNISTNRSRTYRHVQEVLRESVGLIEQRFLHKDLPSGVTTGFPSMDELLGGFQASELIIIGARPSIGKTAFALTMAGMMAVHHKIGVGFFSLEMSSSALVQRLISCESKVNMHKMRTGRLNTEDWGDIQKGIATIYESSIFLDDTPGLRLLELRSMARQMRAKEDIGILFIDYLTLITVENQNAPRHEQIAEVSRSLKSLARELQIPVVVLSQVGRQSEGKHPTLADLRESGSIEQDADVVIFLHRNRVGEQDDEDGSFGSQGKTSSDGIIKTEVIIAKQRNGPIGTVTLGFHAPYTKFVEMDFHG